MVTREDASDRDWDEWTHGETVTQDETVTEERAAAEDETVAEDHPVTDDESVTEERAVAEEETVAEERDEPDRLTMPVETLAVLNWLGETGVDGVESRLDQVPVGELTVETEQVKIDYAGPETVVSQFGVEDRAGARVSLRSPFTGHVLVLFPVKSANRVASLVLQNAVEDVESVVTTPMGRDALTELCNMMANGFVDEWATVFDTPFDTGPPVAVQNPELTLIQRIFSVAEMGLYLTARLRIPEYDVEAAIFVFPGEEQFVTEISQVGPEVIDR